MQDHRQLFRECVKMLDGPADGPVQGTAADRLMTALGYSGAGGPPPDHETVRNRRALLELAGRMDRVFTLPMPHAAGAHFCGAELSHASFGLEGCSPATIGTGGRGETYSEAFESCMGETAGYLSFLMHENDRARALPLAAAEAHLPGTDTLTWLYDGLGHRPRYPDAIEWCLAEPLSGGDPVAIPFHLCFRDAGPQDRSHRPALSNGVGCGPTGEAALLDALLEVIERDAAALWWYGCAPAANLPAALGAGSPFASWVHAIRGRDADTRRLWFLDITTDIGIPVVAALSCNADGFGIAAGFSAATDLETATRKALLELCQMELARMLSLQGASQADRQGNSQASPHTRNATETLNRSDYPAFTASRAASSHVGAGGKSRISHCVDCISKAGYSIYSVNLTRGYLDIPCVRVFIPGFQAPCPEWTSKRLSRILVENGHPPDMWTKIPFLV